MKRIGYVLFLLLGASSVRADGRLFYTPEQRAGLEQARQHHVTEVKATQPDSANRPLTFNGVVLRSDGRNTEWINGHPVSGTVTAPRFRGLALKPGQTAANGKIYEPHQIIRETQP